MFIICDSRFSRFSSSDKFFTETEFLEHRKEITRALKPSETPVGRVCKNYPKCPYCKWYLKMLRREQLLDKF